MKLRIIPMVLVACSLIVPGFAQDKMKAKPAAKPPKMSKMAKPGPKMAKPAPKMAKTQKVAKTESKMKDLGHGVFQDAQGKYRSKDGKFMSKANAEKLLGGKKGPARDPKTGRFMKKDGPKPAPKMAKAPKAPKPAKKK